MQCAVSASHHVQSSNNAPQATTVNQLRHKCTEITQKKYNKPNGRKGQKQGSQQKSNQFKGQQCSQNQNQGKQLKCYNCGENFNGDYEKITNLGANLEINMLKLQAERTSMEDVQIKRTARIGKI